MQRHTPICDVGVVERRLERLMFHKQPLVRPQPAVSCLQMFFKLLLAVPNVCGCVMEQGKSDINGPHQGAWVETESGQSWFLHFQDKRAYGRVVHLQPMKWVDDWPVIGADPDGNGKGEPLASFR